MKKHTSLLALILSLSISAGCAATRESAAVANDYVEIDNPAFTMSPNAPPTIWVPRSYAESGIPRGGDLIDKGFDKIRGNAVAGGADQQQVAQQASPAVQSAVSTAVPRVSASPRVKNRIFIVEIGRGGLLARFSDLVRRETGDLVLDPAKSALIARYATVATPADRAALALKLQEDFGANVVLYILAPEGISPGGAVAVDIHEANGGTLVRRLNAAIKPFAASDATAREVSLSAALSELAAQTRAVTALLPWYCKVVSVDGDRIYINAGKESGLQIGARLNVYRGGSVVEKLGFAPGGKIGVLEITGFVGTDGAFGVMREGGKVLSSDLVGVE